MAENLGEARLRLTANASDLNSKVKNAQAGLRTAGVAMTATGAAVLAPLAAGTKVFAEYEQSMAKVKAVSGATEAEFAALDAVAREMGKTTVFTARESAEALSFYGDGWLECGGFDKCTPACS